MHTAHSAHYSETPIFNLRKEIQLNTTYKRVMTAYTTSNHLKLMSRNAPTCFPETHSSAWNREERSTMRREKQIRGASQGCIAEQPAILHVIVMHHIKVAYKRHNASQLRGALQNNIRF